MTKKTDLKHEAVLEEAWRLADPRLADAAVTSILLQNPLHPGALRLSSLLRASAGDFPEALASAIVLTTVEPNGPNWKLRGELELELAFRYAATRSLNRAKALGESEIDELLRKVQGLPDKYGWKMQGQW